MKALARSGITAVSLLLLAAPISAQVPAVDLKVNPRIGLYEPLGSLGEAPAAASNAAAELSGSLAVGLGVEIGIAALPVDFRLNLDYATGSDVSTEGLDEGSDATMLAVVADLMFRPLPRLVVLQPFLFAGGGLRQYDFDPADATGFQDASDPTLHLGGGLELWLGPMALTAEIGDYISWFDVQAAATGDDDSEMQHDLFVAIGFAIGLL